MDDPLTKPTTTKGGCYENFRASVERIAQADAHKPVALFTHAYPDPDAIGSMMGMAWLLRKKFNMEADLFYDGEISHPQNMAIVNLLDPQLKRVEEYDPSRYCMNMLLDTVPVNAGVGDHKLDFKVVVDHHQTILNGSYDGVFVHHKTGSCCAIVYRMMRCFCSESWLEDDNAGDSRVATAMVAGVITDTDYMVSDATTEMEFEAYADLFEYRNSAALRNIIFYKRPKSWTYMKASAVQRVEIDENGHATVGLGILPDSHRDLIADMATDMLTWAPVQTAIVFALVGQDQVAGSIRSHNSSLNVPEFCRKLGGRHGSGGGRGSMGAYHYTIAGLAIDPDDDDETKQKTWDLINVREKLRIQKILND